MNKKSLTLLEIIVATVILALVISGLASVFMVGKRYILHSRSRMSAGEQSKTFLDPLHMDVRQDLWSNTCLGGNQAACPGAQTIPPENITYTPSWSITDVSGTSLRRVRVTINWTERSP